MKKKTSKQSPQPTFLQLTTPNANNKKPKNVYMHPYLVKNLHNIKRSTQSMESPQSKERSKGGFGSLDPLLAAVFLAGVRLSMNQNNKANAVATKNNLTKSKRSSK